MIIRRIAAGLIGTGIILSGTAYATQPNPDHKITICHSGNGKHFTAIKVDYAGARGHAKTDSDDIIPAFEDSPGQGDQSILENSCNVEITTTIQSTLTSTTSTVPSTLAPTTTTTTSMVTSTTRTTVPQTPASTTTLPPATTTSTTVATRAMPTTTVIPATTIHPQSSTPTPTLATSSTTVNPPATAISIPSLPVTGTEPTGLVYGGLALLALGIVLVIVSR